MTGKNAKRKSGARDRTKTGPTPRRGGKPPRVPGRLGPLTFLLALLFGGVLVIGAWQWTPGNLDHLAATAGWSGAEGTLRVTDCQPHKSPKGAVSYTCSGPVEPASAAPGAVRGVVWIGGERDDLRGRTVAVDCPAAGDDCVRTGSHALVGAVALVYVMIGLYAVGVGAPLGAAYHRWPGAFGWFARRRVGLRKAAGWTAAGVGAAMVALLILAAALG
ncbi:hypothetical protein CFP65_6291 [Kitasatospora sp. MMS16-BH015]|uniref:hypothetical protein n=1 Tax=Kitasatospora sp. MMS16-BH015 TaxID=2018025 RepID=UPI000CA0C9F2|nr:hypothetical protein [Kitasatospora sp. MMS16-BH015]AUG80953.1 hypothetical protein CFP65_6291 [Kitasatospora sp. MMS16-BH015]